MAENSVFRKPARTLDKLQVVVTFPVQNRVLVNAIHRTDQLHALEVFAVQLRKHRLQLSAVKHRHHGRLDDVTEMMSQGNFVAAKLLCLAV